ncbi:MAG: hypothetical protein E5W91_29495 [Mesorhizobium sp.]|uniref:hypothetical protein n=1 Tax=Mesorhizobium sp. TaxID=1871066 RepID=UPI00122512A0|nr:hypothetical protein [Mesorhizobium sp.]TIS53791.1 MAG: hypothetical protein E5W91_29495 [Mesorhizobium sp.]
MEVNELFAREPEAMHRGRDAAPVAAPAIAKPADPGRPRCADVARNRAARYARKRRIPISIWPLISAAILVGLIFERRSLPILSRAAGWSTGTGGDKDVDAPTPEPAATQDDGMVVDAADTGEPEPQYLPPAQFLAKDVAQLVAFLVRNRGRLDNETVRAKWKIVDRISLPLAVYLREVEAHAAWDDLEREISAAPFGAPTVFEIEMPKSLRYRKILRLMPEWCRRGVSLISGDQLPDSEPKPVPTADGDDRPDAKPRKP